MKGVIYGEDPIARLRELRNKECFPIINRGKLWYDMLTFSQVGELKKWYTAWLNVTETLEIPKAPDWLYQKISEEEIIL